MRKDMFRRLHGVQLSASPGRLIFSGDNIGLHIIILTWSSVGAVYPYYSVRIHGGWRGGEERISEHTTYVHLLYPLLNMHAILHAYIQYIGMCLMDHGWSDDPESVRVKYNMRCPGGSKQVGGGVIIFYYFIFFVRYTNYTYTRYRLCGFSLSLSLSFIQTKIICNYLWGRMGWRWRRSAGRHAVLLYG